MMKLSISTEMKIVSDSLNNSQLATKTTSRQNSRESTNNQTISDDNAQKMNHTSLVYLPETLAEANLHLKPPPNSNKFGSSLPSFVLTQSDVRIKRQKSENHISTPLGKLKNLSNLYALCLKLFEDVDISKGDVKALSSVETELLSALLKRKFGRGFKKAELKSSVATRLDALRLIRTRARAKRPEECYKFVLSRGFKLLKQQFREQNGVKDDDAFHLYYFGELCQSGELLLSDFFARAKSSEAKTPTKVTVRYIRLVTRSPRFCRDMEVIFESDLFAHCRAEIQSKLHSLLAKLAAWLEDDVEQSVALRRALTYLASNRYCKLPWTLEESRHALERLSAVWSSAGISESK